MPSGLAAAHAVHYDLTVVPGTHSFFPGEKVANGLLVQLLLEGQPRFGGATGAAICRRSCFTHHSGRDRLSYMNMSIVAASLAPLCLPVACPPAAADYVQEVRKDKPIAYYRFTDHDTGEGREAASGVRRHLTTYHGGVQLDNGVPATDGRAAVFDGKAAYVNIPDQAGLPQDILSVEFWFQSTQPFTEPYWPGSATLISKATAGNGSGDWVIIGASTVPGADEGRIVVGIGPKPGCDVLIQSPTGLNDGRWHHVVWTRSAGGAACLYIDGSLAATAHDGGGSITNSRPIQVGADPFLKGKPFRGLMAEVALYAHVLRPERIAAHARAGGLRPKEWLTAARPVRPLVLRADQFRHYIEAFNRNDHESVINWIDNASCWDWVQRSVPLFECPDRDIEEVYYFRWWAYRKHIRQTLDGFVVTEFLPPVGWAGKHNTISCPAGHHLYEGRWLHDRRYLDDYSRFWFRKGGDPRRYSFWAADAVYARYLGTGGRAFTLDLLDDLIANYRAWEKSRQDPNGLFWQEDGQDGMEVSIGGSGYRPTINSYMYGDALAIAAIAELAGRYELALQFRSKAAKLKQLVQDRLWDREAQFFKVLPRKERAALVDVRELHGFVPWYFNLPGPQYSMAWKQLLDPNGFAAAFGPTTAERRHSRFMFKHDHECLWNGPSWPFATTQTLVALANLLNNCRQEAITRKDYLDLLRSYARSQHRKLADGTVVPWIDEDLHPDTGEWLARGILERRGVKDRGRDYNHSGFADPVISGLVGLRPRADDVVEVNALVPEGVWEYFCLDQVPYHGLSLTILYDRSGRRYGKGQGLRVFADGKEVAHSDKLTQVTGLLPVPTPVTPPGSAASTASGWVKHPQNPVLGGALGTCFDICVLKEGDTYRMWFSWRPRQSIALTESKDGIHWSKPVIVLGPNRASGWEDDVNRPVVLQRPDGYHLWYTGQAKGHSWIGYATSRDGKSWQRHGPRPVLAPEQAWEKVAVMCPHVLYDESAKLYRMWYSGGEQYEPNAIGHATSPDGRHWTRHSTNPVFRPEASNAWEKDRVTACQVLRQGDGYVMFYIGFRDEAHAQIGLARSKDGITGWQRHRANPIIRPGQGQWDHDAVYKPFAVFDGRRWLLWYNGRRGGVEQIGLAIHEGPDLWASPP
jgi:predicted GH43/DUF377 family glycosyl hydrolase